MKMHICWRSVSNRRRVHNHSNPSTKSSPSHQFTHTHHDSNSSLKGLPDSPIPSFNTSQILPLQTKSKPPISSSQYLPIPSPSAGPRIRRNFLPLPRRRPSLSPVPLFSQWPKIYDNKIPDAAKREGWPRGDPRFSHHPLSHFFTHLSW